MSKFVKADIFVKDSRTDEESSISCEVNIDHIILMHPEDGHTVIFTKQGNIILNVPFAKFSNLVNNAK